MGDIRSDVLLRSALFYLRYWGMNPLFTNVYKRPLHDEWTPFYMAELSPEDVIREYVKIVRDKGRRPAGVALIPSARSRMVILDLDEVWRHGFDVEEAARRLAKHFVVAVTPRGGLRIVFRVPENGYVPHRVVITRFGEKLGEGGGTWKHPWTVPPSVACAEDVEEERRCSTVKQYYFVLPNGRKARYPWEVPLPPVIDWETAKDIIEAFFQAEVSVAEEKVSGDLRVGTAAFPVVPIPCWRNLDHFAAWLEAEQRPALPACVARALGYRYDPETDSIEYTGEPVPRGYRFTLGAIAVMFLAATVAEKTPEELIEYVGRNLEDFPKDTGEPLNTKLSRLLVRAGSIVVPRYMGVGFLSNIPPNLCSACRYRERCMKAVIDVGGEIVEVASGRPVWWIYAIEFWKTWSRRINVLLSL